MSDIKGVFLDAFGTILELEPPAPKLVRELREGWGIEMSEEDARRALRAEITYYKAHHLDGRDAESLAELRLRCAGVLHRELPESVRAVASPAELLPAMLGSLEFRPFPDAAAALRRFRKAGLLLVVVSNWDVSLHEAIERCRFDGLVDHVVSSAEAGAAKPDPVPFERALELTGLRPGSVVHVGDEPELDVAGARAAGITPVLIQREAGPVPKPDPPVRVISDLNGFTPT